jgi:hypothetical protein
MAIDIENSDGNGLNDGLCLTSSPRPPKRGLSKRFVSSNGGGGSAVSNWQVCAVLEMVPIWREGEVAGAGELIRRISAWSYKAHK